MLFYLFSPAEFAQIFARLGYRLTGECVQRKITHYTHRSTLSQVNTRVGHRPRRPAASWHQFTEAFAIPGRDDTAKVAP